MTNKIGQSTPAEKIPVVLGEALRHKLARVILEQDIGPDLPDDEIDRRIEVLDQQSIDLKRDARRNDFTKVESTISTAAGKIGLPVQSPLSNDLGRRAIDLIRAIMDLEGKVLDGEDARAGARPLVAQFSDTSVDQFVSSKSVSLSEFWDKALKLYPSKDMKGNIDAIAKIAIIYFADIPVATIAAEDQENFSPGWRACRKSTGKGMARTASAGTPRLSPRNTPSPNKTRSTRPMRQTRRSCRRSGE
ncbi:hypothetical protein [Phaeovulum sp.]|uniref:hypothetical protein n=1 Tax=Phaeovulum sp. TaxID=2934796 RepID=UPI0039E21CF1